MNYYAASFIKKNCLITNNVYQILLLVGEIVILSCRKHISFQIVIQNMTDTFDNLTVMYIICI